MLDRDQGEPFVPMAPASIYALGSDEPAAGDSGRLRWWSNINKAGNANSLIGHDSDSTAIHNGGHRLAGRQ